jgi:hypothetical protein
MKLSALLLLTALAGAGAAYAQAPGGGPPPGGPPGLPPEVQAARAAMLTACAADMTSLCPGKAAGRDANECLRDAAPKVSPGCAAAISKLPAPGNGGAGGGRRPG